jgi:hypothetical protein
MLDCDLKKMANHALPLGVGTSSTSHIFIQSG